MTVSVVALLEGSAGILGIGGLAQDVIYISVSSDFFRIKRGHGLGRGFFFGLVSDVTRVENFAKLISTLIGQRESAS